jgi:antitoxin VapB
LFAIGRSQAVRLPKEFRFEGDKVIIRKEGQTVILEPIKLDGWPRNYWKRLREMRVDLVARSLRPQLGEPEVD